MASPIELPQHTPTWDAQYTAAEELEALADNPAFDAMIRDNLVSRFVDFGQSKDTEIYLRTSHLPSLVAESLQYFHGVTSVTGFYAGWAYWPADGKGMSANWALNAWLYANDSKLDMHSSDYYGTELVTDGHDGSRIAYKCRHEDISAVVSGIMLSAVKSNDAEIPILSVHNGDPYQHLGEIIATLGNVCGQSIVTSRAVIPSSLKERALVVEKTVTETPTTSERSVKVMMGWALASSTFENAATNEDTVCHVGKGEIAKRVTYLDRGEVFGDLESFNLSAGDTENRFYPLTRLDAAEHTPAWRASALGIMTVLRPQLRRYEQTLDATLDSND